MKSKGRRVGAPSCIGYRSRQPATDEARHIPSLIREVPVVPDSLRLAAEYGNVVPFVGASTSRIAGCPGWDALAERAFEHLAGTGVVNYGFVAQTRAMSARTRLSLARQVAEAHSQSIDFRSLIQPDKWETNQDGRRVYRALGMLGTSFVTTNYDEWLDRDFGPMPAVVAPVLAGSEAPHSRRPLYRPEDMTIANLEVPGSVLHLHGSLLEPKSLVMTTAEYLRFYSNPVGRENPVLSFLRALFDHKNVLFVGYGLAELEILEYVIGKSNNNSATQEPRHFLLGGYYTHEEELVRSMTDYYAAMGVMLVPYSRNTRDWRQLIQVLEAFAQAAPARPLALSKQKLEMEALLNDAS